MIRFVVAGLVVVAGATTWAALSDDPIDGRVLVVDESGAISLLDPATGDAVFEVPRAVPTPDRSALLTTRSADGETVLESRDPSTGEVTGSTPLGGSLTVRTVSPSSGVVALMPGPRPTALYEPAPRDETNMTIAYTDDRPSRRFQLAGNIEPEMFSLDETVLFVLEFLPPTEPTSYVVRMLNLATGELTDTESPQVELNPQMRGRARAQALHPEGTYLYTLYTVSSTTESAHSAFIHVINLDEKWSFCIFLPAPIGAVNEATVGMGLAPDGSSLYIADASTSTIARIDAAALEVQEVRRVEQLRDAGVRAEVAVAGDGAVYVGSGPRILELASPTLEPVAVWSHTATVSGLAVSAYGGELQVAGGGQVALVNRSTRQETGVLRAPGGGSLGLLGPPQGSVTQFPLECAC